MVRCWVSDRCKKKSDDNCHSLCVGRVLLEALYTQSKLPERYQYPQKLRVEDDQASYGSVKKYMEAIRDNVERGDGLYLYGVKTGTGKTSLACACMSAYFRSIVFFYPLECKGVYIHVPSFLEAYRGSYDAKTDEFTELLDNLGTAALVIWDDIGAEKPSEWVRERLLALLDLRTGKCLANIFTSNLTLDELSKAGLLGARIGSRIKGCTQQLEFVGEDKRGQSRG